MSLLSSSQIEARSSIHQIQTPQPLIGLIPFYSPFIPADREQSREQFSAETH
jgi:hypothetical protein